MKVPNMYKSSDLYNGGTDVIYNDDSKLQYAPFIYATTESGDSGDGEDEDEGEDGMVVIVTSNELEGTAVCDKTFGEIKTALEAGKFVAFKWGETVSSAIILDTGQFTVSFYYDLNTMGTFTAAGNDGYPTMELGGD